MLRHWITTVVVVVAYASALFYSYKLEIAPYFSYMGMTYRDPDWVCYAISVIATSLVAVGLPLRVKKTSDFILWLLFVSCGAPSILLPQYMRALSTMEATALGLTIAACLLIVRVLVAARPSRGLTHLRLPKGSFWVILACISAVVYLELVVVFGIHLRWLSFDDVYDVRSDFVERSAKAPLIGYLLPLLSKVVNPIFIARGIYSRKALPLLFGAAGQLLIYLTTGQKVVFLSLFGLIGVAVLFRFSPRGFKGITLMAVAAVSSAATLVIDRLIGAPLLTNLLVRRFLVVPGVLAAGYVLVFSDRPKTNFAPFPVFWLDSPYASPARLVGQVFVGDANTNANVSLFGHGYLSLGYFGILIECLVLVLMLWFADAAAKGIPVAVSSLIFFLPTIALSNSSVFTVITTHGFAATVLLCVAMPRNGWGLSRRRSRSAPVSVVAAKQLSSGAA